MKSNIDDKCQEVFKEIKIKKAHRYVSYKVDQERVVRISKRRSSTKSDKEDQTGDCS